MSTLKWNLNSYLDMDMDTATNQPTNHRAGPLISFSYRFLGLAVLTLPAQTSALPSQYALKINRPTQTHKARTWDFLIVGLQRSWLGRNQVCKQSTFAALKANSWMATGDWITKWNKIWMCDGWSQSQAKEETLCRCDAPSQSHLMIHSSSGVCSPT